MIAAVFVVFVEDEIDVIGVYITALTRARFAQRLAYLIAQLAVDPLFQRYSKSLLRPIEYFRRDQIPRHAFQQMLCFRAGQLQ